MRNIIKFLFFCVHFGLFFLIIFPIGLILASFNLCFADIHNYQKSFLRLQEITVIPLWNFWFNLLDEVVRVLKGNKYV